MTDPDPEIISPPSTPQRRGGSPNKRVCAGHDPFTDADATPRALFDMRPPPPPTDYVLAASRSSPSKSSSGRSSPSKSSGRSSRASGRSSKTSSPVKSLAPFTFRPVTIEAQQFDGRFKKTPMPAALRGMLSNIRRFANGYHVVSESMRSDIARMDADFIDAFTDEAMQAFDLTGSRDIYGPTPTAESVDAIQQQAEKCDAEGYNEAAWTCLVHTPLILLALERNVSKRKVDFVPCNTAAIQPAFLIPPGQGADARGTAKMVDGALVIEPDDRMRRAIYDRLSLQDRFRSINHTEHQPLLTRPISVNVEIKRTGEHWHEAQVQHGVWVTAQFGRLAALVADVRDEQRFRREQQLLLRQAAYRQLPSRPLPQPLSTQPPIVPAWDIVAAPSTAAPATLRGDVSSVITSSTTATLATAAASSTPSFSTATQSFLAAPDLQTADKVSASDGEAEMVPFLPLIVIQGHNWNFLAATQNESGGTYIWNNVCFGTTSSLLGIYKIVATIQYLVHWSDTVYRPWFARHALGMPM